MEKTFYSSHLKTDVTVSINENAVIFLWGREHFYDFDLTDWPAIRERMKEKKWFTNGMDEFLTQNIQPC